MMRVSDFQKQKNYLQKLECNMECPLIWARHIKQKINIKINEFGAMLLPFHSSAKQKLRINKLAE